MKIEPFTTIFWATGHISLQSWEPCKQTNIDRKKEKKKTLSTPFGSSSASVGSITCVDDYPSVGGWPWQHFYEEVMIWQCWSWATSQQGHSGWALPTCAGPWLRPWDRGLQQHTPTLSPLSSSLLILSYFLFLFLIHSFIVNTKPHFLTSPQPPCSKAHLSYYSITNKAYCSSSIQCNSELRIRSPYMLHADKMGQKKTKKTSQLEPIQPPTRSS